MKKKDIMLIANYWHFEEEKASSRYRSFADMLSRDYELEVVTSTFCHLKKEQRNAEALNLANLPYKMTLQYEKGYPKNISFQRIVSYTQFGKNVLKYLEQRKKPDLIIVSVPSLAVADYVTKFANKKDIPVIVDIQDLWPEAFKMALNIPIVSDILFYPMKKQAERVYRRATDIMAVSDTYVEFGKRQNPNCKGLSIYIGTDSALVRAKTEGVRVQKNENEFWIGYVGALGHSYDIRSCILAAKELGSRGYNNVVLKIMGDGVLRKDFEEFAKNQGVKSDFTGLLEYGKMMKTLELCDVALNPIVGKSVSSIINKVSDYAAAGVPVINTQNSPEYRMILEEYKAGISVTNGDVIELADAIQKIYLSEDLRKEMSEGSRRLYVERFDRQVSYPKLLYRINEIVS